MNRPDDPHRYYTVQAAGRVGCLDRATLARMGRDEPDPELRGLARRILDGQ